MQKLLIALAFIASIIFAGVSSSEAVTPGWVPPDDYRAEEPKKSEADQDLSENDEVAFSSQKEMSLDDIFGSEQVFPFPPGLGN